MRAWLLACLATSSALAGVADLSCVPPTTNTDGSPLTDLVSLRPRWGCATSGVYPFQQTFQTRTCQFQIQGLPDTGTCYFVIAAINSAGRESAFSNQAVKMFGVVPSNPTVAPTIAIGGFAVALPLDEIVGEVGYSMHRRMRAAYAGSAFRIRRSSDSTEQDIGFAGDLVDHAAAMAFIGAGSGFVTTIYDQGVTGGSNLVQATTTKQPLYSERSCIGDGTDDFLFDANTALTGVMTYYFYGKQVTFTSGDKFSYGAGGNVGINQFTPSPNIYLYAGANVGPNTNFALNTYNALAAVKNGASSSLRVGNTTKVTGDAGANNPLGLTLFSAADGTSSSNFQLKELIIYLAAHTDGQQDTMVKNMTEGLLDSFQMASIKTVAVMRAANF